MDTKALRQKILDLAIRGKLVPQNPEDEPASVLLEKIRAKKQQMVKDGKLKAKDIKNDSVIYVGEDSLHYEKFADGTVKCIEDEIPFEVPEGWAWSRIFSISQDLPYGTSKKSSSSGEIAVLRMGNLQLGEIDYTDLVYSSNKEDIDKYLLTDGDLLFNRTNSSEWVGKTAIYRGETAAIYAGYLIRIRSFLDAEYLNSVMNSKYIKEICSLVKTDAINQSNINAAKLGHFLIPIPPSKEQVRISNKLSDILYWVNYIVTGKLELQQYIHQIKSRILDLAIQGKLVPQNPNDEPASVLLERIRAEKEELIKQGKIKRNKKESIIFRGRDNSYYEKVNGEERCINEEIPFSIPDSWIFVRLKHISNIIGGGTPKTNIPEYWNGDIPWLTPADFSEYKEMYISSGKRNISELGLNSSSAQLLPADSILYSSRAPIGYIAIAGNSVTTNQGFKSVVPYNKKMSRYLYYCLKARTENIVLRATGTTFKEISGSEMAETIVPLPPIEEQERISDKITQLLTEISEIEKNLN